MFRKFALVILSVTLLGMTVGCGGPGKPSTVSDEERTTLNKPGVDDGKTSTLKGPDGEDLPEGVAPVD